MKRMFAAALCLFLFLSACTQGDGRKPEKTTAGTQSAAMNTIDEPQGAITNTDTDSQVSQQDASPSDNLALYFSGEMPDPQSMQPAYEPGTLIYEGTFTSLAEGGYEAALHLTRYFPQGVNPMTGAPQQGGYMNLGYDSIGFAGAAELPPEAKAALDEKSAGDTGQRQYGLLPMRSRTTSNTMQTTGSFYLPIDYSRHFSSTTELPYLLITQGDNVALYLYLNPLATVKLPGTLTVPPAPEPHQSATATQMLYFNDEGRTPEQNKRKDVWNILFLGEKSGDHYNGTLRLWRWREQTGSAPTNLCYIPGEASAYEQTISLIFNPFDETAYLSAGGKMNGRQRAVLSGMATVNCGGQTVLFTVCCDTVYAELPGMNVGVFEGRFTGEADIGRIYEESLTLYNLAHSYHLSPLSPVPQDLAAGNNFTTEHAEMVWGAPGGVPGFIPEEWIKAVNPTSFLEKRPATLIFGNYQYTDAGNWLDVTGPLYRQQLAGMRDLQIEEGETSEGTGYEMEISFRYGNRTVAYYLADTPIGTSVSIIIY